MKKWVLIMAAVCLMLAGCSKVEENVAADTTQTEKPNVETEVEQNASSNAEQEEPAAVVHPLPDTTMENLNDAILSISLEEGGAYVDDTGKMQMDVKIYTYDKYDMVDIATLKVGDVIVTHDGEVEVTALERNENGLLFINGGEGAGGFDMFTNDSGIFFRVGFSDVKNWYEVGEVTLPVSTEFECRDTSDPDKEEVVFFPGDFLIEGVVNYHFTPHNTTIRVEAGRIVEMNRVYTP